MATESTYSNIRGQRSAGSRAAAAVRDLEADRVIGIVGALTVVVATGLSWYSERVAIAAHGVGGAAGARAAWPIRGRDRTPAPGVYRTAMGSGSRSNSRRSRGARGWC